MPLFGQPGSLFGESGSLLGSGCKDSCCLGACCSPAGICSQITQEDCTSLGGTFFGYGVGCGEIVCEPPDEEGACCLPSGLCVSVLSSECLSQGGSFQGAGTLCSDVSCPPPPPHGCCSHSLGFNCFLQGAVGAVPKLYLSFTATLTGTRCKSISEGGGTTDFTPYTATGMAVAFSNPSTGGTCGLTSLRPCCFSFTGLTAVIESPLEGTTGFESRMVARATMAQIFHNSSFPQGKYDLQMDSVVSYSPSSANPGTPTNVATVTNQPFECLGGSISPPSLQNQPGQCLNTACCSRVSVEVSDLRYWTELVYCCNPDTCPPAPGASMSLPEVVSGFAVATSCGCGSGLVGALDE